MSYLEVQPPLEASQLSCAVWYTNKARPSLILPDGCSDIIFVPKQKRVFVVGVMTRAITSSIEGVEVFGLRLQPWAAQSVLGVNAAALCDRSAALEDVAPNVFSRLRLVDSVPSLLHELSTYSSLQRSLDARVVSAVQRLQANNQEKVEDLAQDLDLSTRQLQRLFLLHVGITPKHLARIIRLQQAKRAAREYKLLSDVSAEAGYADQSHLCREVRSLTGQAPNRLMSDLFKPNNPLV